MTKAEQRKQLLEQVTNTPHRPLRAFATLLTSYWDSLSSRSQKRRLQCPGKHWSFPDVPGLRSRLCQVLYLLRNAERKGYDVQALYVAVDEDVIPISAVQKVLAKARREYNQDPMSASFEKRLQATIRSFVRTTVATPTEPTQPPAPSIIAGEWAVEALLQLGTSTHRNIVDMHAGIRRLSRAELILALIVDEGDRTQTTRFAGDARVEDPQPEPPPLEQPPPEATPDSTEPVSAQEGEDDDGDESLRLKHSMELKQRIRCVIGFDTIDIDEVQRRLEQRGWMPISRKPRSYLYTALSECVNNRFVIRVGTGVYRGADAGFSQLVDSN